MVTLRMDHADFRILVFQHIAVEHPGSFRDFLAVQGVPWDVVELDEGDAIPELGNYSGLWAMGGPMDVWQEDEYPWLVDEKAAIREAVLVRRMPFLGVCLGHQLLADALGGEVGPAEITEVGILEVAKTSQGEANVLLEGLPPSMHCLQWHGAEVKRLPDNAEALMSSPACAVQALSVEGYALGIQFHFEVTPTTVSEWVAVPTYRSSLERNLGAGGLTEFEAETRASLATLNVHARCLYDNWMRMATGAVPTAHRASALTTER